MPQFGSRDVATSVALLTALLCLGFAGCQAESKTPAWFDAGSDTSMDVEDDEPVESFLPNMRPDDAICTGNWCWMYPRPFPNGVDELRRGPQLHLHLAIRLAGDDPAALGRTAGFVVFGSSVLRISHGQRSVKERD